MPTATIDLAPARDAVPNRPQRQRQVSDFADLLKTVQNLGLMRRRYGYYWAKFVGFAAMYAALGAAFVWLGDSWWQLAVAAALAILLTQTAFLAHDAAHRQIFNSGKRNEWASLIITNLMLGMSYGWWQNKHSRHHANPNKVGKDPDIETDTIVFLPEKVPNTSALGKWWYAHQGYFFFPLILLEGLNLHYQGVKTVIGRKSFTRRAVEISFIAVRLVGYVAVVFWLLSPGIAVAFLAVQLGLFGFYMGCSFAPNHKGMPIVPKDVSIDFLRRQVLMSRNITGGRLTDILYGGLNYQIEHHLFPSMPRVGLRKVQPIVKQYCQELGVKYTETTAMQSYRIVVQYLNRVGLGERDPFTCPITATYRSR